MPIIHGLASALNFSRMSAAFAVHMNGLRFVVVLIDVSTDCHNQLFDIAENASS
jgi:hypothetical protein